MENENAVFQKPKKMSMVAERELLKKLLKSQPIGNGSSRMVFIHPTDNSKIVKVAVGAKSLRQNTLEVEMYRYNGDSGFLARIFEYGRFCIVMERMVACYEEEEEPQDDYGYDAYRDVHNWLDDMFGYTSDNGQIGKTMDGRYVAYDYGFNPNMSSTCQVGFADSIGWSDDFRDYLKRLRWILINKKPANQNQIWRAAWDD